MNASVDYLFKAFSFGKAKQVFHRVAKPTAIVERAQERLHEVFTCEGISFECGDAVLKLKEHVQADNHHFLQVWVRNFFIEEMSSDKCA